MSDSFIEPDVVLEARAVSKAFPGVQALDGVSLVVRSGRLHALLGENGAGKSTLMGILAGVFPPDAGEIFLHGRSIAFRNPQHAREAGVAIIFQERNLFPDLTVAQNIFLGREPLTRAGLIDDERMNREAGEWLRRLKLDVDPRGAARALRVGQQQVVEIARALSLRARILIMDEPTSAITGQEIAVLFELIRDLKRQGVAIVYITHKLDELPQIADEFTVMRDGRRVAHSRVGSSTRADIVRLMVGRELAPSAPRPPAQAGEPLLQADKICLPHPERAGDFLVRDVSLHVRRGEVLGLFGMLGAGRTELLETLFGLHAKSATGSVSIEGRAAWFRSAREAIAAGVVLAPEDRQHEGLVLSLSVAANTSLACLADLERGGLLDAGREAALAESYVRRLGTRTPSVHQLTRHLSGGNQQKVVLAKWLATRPKVLLLDEPTRGIDLNAKREIYALIEELVGAGLGVVLVSSELPELLALADRTLVLCEGRAAAEFARADATEEKLLQAALPVGTTA